MLNKLKGEDEDKVIGQLVAQNKEKISKIKEAQKKVQEELNSIKNPQAVEKGKKGSSMEKKDGKSPQKQSKNNK